jgi:glycogen debranching enzyme
VVVLREMPNCKRLRLFLIVSMAALSASASAQSENNLSRLRWSTDSVGPARFVSAHGRRAAVFGYSQDGLEVWAYPFQIISSYKVSFHSQGTATAIDGQNVLRRIIYSPEAVTRIYTGPDFIVRERIFVPVDEPGAIMRYEVESRRSIDIDIHFVPVLNLMWPGGIGGQEALWQAADSAYILSEPMHRFSGSIGSPDIIAHDETSNQNRQLGRNSGLAFTVRAGGDHPNARVFIAGGEQGTAIAISKRLQQNEASLEKMAADHYTALLNNALQIETPDAEINRALAWSEIALEQAWVCNPDLGCGLVAGYGPSRNARRPQYDWFFAGDGMVDLPALLAAGEYTRAREELEFILKYQDQKTGMIWHELSQSAGWIDWNKYPYMFVHVELTFDFLSAVEQYFSATGDRDFVAAHWAAIQSAYNYCQSLVDRSDGLPRIPPEKEGSREQEGFSEELALSANWVSASQAFADLANATGHSVEAAKASAADRKAREFITRRYWDDKQNFWITGHTRSGSPLLDREIGPVDILSGTIFSNAQRESVLQQLATSDFESDWGTRGRASTSATYDPNSYADGSVWAASTSSVATAFWSAHRPATAFQIWSALIPWSSLDSFGHLHETLAGDYYHEEFESVPEQTWSSATFFSAAVNGLLGVQLNAASNHVTFAPHLPPSWHEITLRHVRVGSSDLQFQLSASQTEIRLEVQNTGGPVKLTFAPEIPLGTQLGRARLQGHPVSVSLESYREDTHAKVDVGLPHGDSLIAIDYSGGVEIEPAAQVLAVGDASHGIKITRVNLQGETYTVDYDYLPAASASFELYTPWTITRVEGARLEKLSQGAYKVAVDPLAQNAGKTDYHHGEVKVSFVPGEPSTRPARPVEERHSN